MRSAIEIMTRPCSSANARHCGARIIVPSSLTSSHSAPAADSPARRARSTAASVCPGRRSTPPSIARSGTTWPGRVSSHGSVAESESTLMVRARSSAEMPVDFTSRASTVTAYAVPFLSSLTSVIGGRPSRSRSRPGIATQM